MKFFGDTDDANSGGGSPSTISISSDPYGFGSGGGPSGGGPSGGPASTDAGKGSFDFSDPLGSIGDTLGHFGEFMGGVGKIGIPGGPNLGGIAEAASIPVRFSLEVAGNALGAVGGIELPYLGSDPSRTNARIRDVPGMAGDILGALERFVETGAAKGRLSGNSGGTDLLAQIGRFAFGSNTDTLESIAARYTERGEALPADLAAAIARQDAENAPLPTDIQARLDAGEDVDTLAAEMVERGQGFSNSQGANLLASLVLDPLNLLSFGAGKAATFAKNADRALQAGETLGVGQRFMGIAYRAASRGMSAGGQALMDHTVGPATSGVFHALGTRPYNAVKNAAAGIGREYGTAFEDAFARGAAQLPRAVIARYMAEEATSVIKRYGAEAAKRLPGSVRESIEARLSAIRTVNNDQIERRTEELLTRVAPDFAGHTDEARFIESRDKLAQITGMSPEDAARALGNKADVRMAQTIHLAFYGKAGDDLSRAKATVAALAKKNIDPERLTVIADDTLTVARADAILDGTEDLVAAVDRYSILRNRFGNTAFDHAKVREFIHKLRSEDALAEAVKAPITGRNALPKALQDWKASYDKFGYEIGFAPKDGWKTIITEDGEVIAADPFVHFVSEADPLTQRNPLGRFMDSLFRGSTQTQIIADSRARMVAVTRPGGISANEARAVHQRILQTAAEAGVSPRGLSLGPSNTYGDIFREVLGDEKFNLFIQKVDPDFAVMKAFEGNLSRIGLTQKLTGKAKTATATRGNIVAAIAEGIYPEIRFRRSPLFQTQEITESPFLNLLRGVRKRAVSDDVAKVYDELADLPDFKYLSEAGYTLNIAGSTEVARTMTASNTLMGKALSKVPNVKAFKERARVAQVFHEHGAAFEEAVNSINPKLWRTMTEAYGTTDARIVADNFIRERMALASGEIDEAMATFDSCKSAFIQTLYNEGRVAEGQAANIAGAVARGGNAAGGAMKLTAKELEQLGAKPLAQSHDAETVWQAFRESFRQVSEQAFTTHYFNPKRGFLERTINHPYLGIYPASYMWGKVLPEFARFLLLRPFGVKAPLVGLTAYQRVQQTVLATIAQDPDLQQWVDDSAKHGGLYLLEQLLPATPQNLPANAPAWARHLSQDLSAGKEIDPEKFITREAGDAAKYAFGPARSLSVAAGALGDIGDITGDLFENLAKSAAQLDAAYPRP